MNSIILIILLVAFIEAIFKHVDIFEEFINGVKEGSKLLLTIFPTMMAFMLWVTCFQSCGIINILESVFKSVFQVLNIPIDIFMMMLVRPFSSNGSLSVLNNVFLKIKKDSTVLDVLKTVNQKYDLNLKTRKSSFGTYIFGIGNIEEKICGSTSGWMYSVNDIFPGQSASSYRLNDNDKIKWCFTCKPGDLN